MILERFVSLWAQRGLVMCLKDEQSCAVCPAGQGAGAVQITLILHPRVKSTRWVCKYNYNSRFAILSDPRFSLFQPQLQGNGLVWSLFIFRGCGGKKEIPKQPPHPPNVTFFCASS